MTDTTAGQPEPKAEIESLKAELAAAVAAKQEAESQLKYAQADVINARKTAADDVANAKKFGAMPLVKEMVGIIDIFNMAISSFPENVKKDPEAKAVIDGVEMIQMMFTQGLARHGILEIDAKGKKFDPNLHQAVSHCAVSEDTPANHIGEVNQKGYTLNGRVVRPAMVLVAK